MFRKGQKAWNKGTKGLIKPNSGSFKKGMAKAPTAGMKKGQKRGPQPEWHKLKNRLGHLGKIMREETKRKIGDAHRGEKSFMWIKDRSLLKKHDRRSDSAYKEWRKNVYQRDGWKCRISNPDCEGRIEAHHILGWTKYPELRYQINNGITLCHAHHPRKKVDEAKLSPFFQKLVAEMK